MDDPQFSRATAAYTARLDRVLKGLQDLLEEQEAALESLRSSTAPIESSPSSDPKAHLQQLRLLKKTYESLTSEVPYLPSPDSPLPGLVALQDTEKCIKETEECQQKTEADFKQLQKRLEREKGDLNDAKLIQSGLESRISSLQTDIEEGKQKIPSQIAEDLARDITKKKTYYDTETGKLVTAFNDFIDNNLAAMLAAEELGGPIAGDLVEIDDPMLEAGFSARGRVRRTSSKMQNNEDKRQRRIDEIWGPRPSPSADGDVVEEPWDEKRAAAAEMRELTEQLLNSLVEADGRGSGVYVELPRESAAARFLVRSKIAQFHPRDAEKLRLIDFGGEIDA